MLKKRSKNWLDSLPLGLLKWGINWWPPFLGAGIKVKTIQPDFRYIEVVLKEKWYNRNYVGTHFGGSMFNMTDPFFMLMLLKNLGPQYIVWDKAASIEFKKPGRGLLRAIFSFSEEKLTAIREKADDLGKYVFQCEVNILDSENDIVAAVVKTLYVKRKEDKAKPLAQP